MGTDPFEGVRRVVFAHAHPDDETLATGALIQHLAEAGVA
ncbi:MAG: GlcNAc-PI de-N-acetylase, partial [Propionibacterium sp.]|nr:GlcNAc-PI de-N-acetylase [Propionibacterium sp.]